MVFYSFSFSHNTQATTRITAMNKKWGDFSFSFVKIVKLSMEHHSWQNFKCLSDACNISWFRGIRYSNVIIEKPFKNFSNVCFFLSLLFPLPFSSTFIFREIHDGNLLLSYKSQYRQYSDNIFGRDFGHNKRCEKRIDIYNSISPISTSSR